MGMSRWLCFLTFQTNKCKEIFKYKSTVYDLWIKLFKQLQKSSFLGNIKTCLMFPLWEIGKKGEGVELCFVLLTLLRAGGEKISAYNISFFSWPMTRVPMARQGLAHLEDRVNQTVTGSGSPCVPHNGPPLTVAHCGSSSQSVLGFCKKLAKVVAVAAAGLLTCLRNRKKSNTVSRMACWQEWNLGASRNSGLVTGDIWVSVYIRPEINRDGRNSKQKDFDHFSQEKQFCKNVGLLTYSSGSMKGVIV